MGHLLAPASRGDSFAGIAKPSLHGPGASLIRDCQRDAERTAGREAAPLVLSTSAQSERGLPFAFPGETIAPPPMRLSVVVAT